MCCVSNCAPTQKVALFVSVRVALTSMQMDSAAIVSLTHCEPHCEVVHAIASILTIACEYLYLSKYVCDI